MLNYNMDPFAEHINRQTDRQTEYRKIYNTKKHEEGSVPCKN